MDIKSIKGNIKKTGNQIANAGLEKRIFSSSASVAANISDRNKPDADIIIAEAIQKITQAASQGEYAIKLDTGNTLITKQVARHFAKKGYIVKFTCDNLSGAVCVCWMGSKKYRKEWYGFTQLTQDKLHDLVARIIDTVNESVNGYGRFSYGGSGLAANKKARVTEWCNPKFGKVKDDDLKVLSDINAWKTVLDKL